MVLLFVGYDRRSGLCSAPLDMVLENNNIATAIAIAIALKSKDKITQPHGKYWSRFRPGQNNTT